MARLASVLLIDPDPRGLSTLSFGFVREGARVTGATSYDDGVDRAQSDAFDVVVVGLRNGADEARELIEDLAERDGKPIALVGLGREEHRTLVQAMPSADFLPMPAFIRDIVTTAKVRASLRSGDGALVQGPLSDFGLFSLVRSLNASQRSAVVQLERANRRGELRFSRGELTFAQVGSHQGAGALNLLLLWEEAALEVRFGTVAKRGQSAFKGKDLIEESERFMRDFAAAARQLGSAQTIFRPRGEATGREDIAAELTPVLRLFDGSRSLADIIDDSPFQVFDTLRIVSRFVDAGLIEAGSDEARARGVPGVRSPVLDEWLQTPGEDEFVRPVGEAIIITRREEDKVTPVPVTQQAPPAEPAVPAVTPPPARTQPLAPLARPIEDSAVVRSAVTDDARSQRVSGTLTARAKQEKSVVQRPSVMIDIPVEAAVVPAANQVPQPTARGVGPAPATPAPVREAPAAPLADVPREAVPVVDERGSRHSTGTVLASKKPVERPERRPTGSIEIAGELLAAMDAYEMNNAPPTPPPVVVVPTAAAPVRVPTPAPVRVPTPVPARIPTPAPAGAAPAAAAPPARSVTPIPAAAAPARPRRPTGEFDALERDFFAREADLYKDEGVEDFSDLDKK